MAVRGIKRLNPIFRMTFGEGIRAKLVIYKEAITLDYMIRRFWDENKNKTKNRLPNKPRYII